MTSFKKEPHSIAVKMEPARSSETSEQITLRFVIAQQTNILTYRLAICFVCFVEHKTNGIIGQTKVINRPTDKTYFCIMHRAHILFCERHT